MQKKNMVAKTSQKQGVPWKVLTFKYLLPSTGMESSPAILFAIAVVDRLGGFILAMRTMESFATNSWANTSRRGSFSGRCRTAESQCIPAV